MNQLVGTIVSLPTVLKTYILRLERWISGEVYILALQRIQVQFLADTWWFKTMWNSSYREANTFF